MSAQDVLPAGLNDRSTGRQVSPVFPKTRNSLWDKTSVGQPTFLHLGYYRKPRICIPEKILKLVQHQCENYGQVNHMLIGSLVVDADGEGVQIQVDRLDTRTNVPLDSLDFSVGSLAISLQVTNNTACERTASADAYVRALEVLQKRCCSRDSIDLCSFIHLYGWGSFYSNTHTTVAHLDFDMLTLGTTFKSTPITPVPLAVTALSKNLATPRNLSTLQGTPKTGYLTMDNTRKVMLVLESDPKCASLPIVGIWVSGVEFQHHPFVWAACLRYIHCSHLQDRACAPPEEFLLVVYTPLHARPEFYQCTTSSGDSCLQFELQTGHEAINMDKLLASPGSGDFVELEMEPVRDGQKREIFDAAKAQHSTTAVKDAGFTGQEDLEPRCAPMPHADKVPVFRPMVPDVSVLWTQSSEHTISPDPLPQMHNNEFTSQQQQTSGSQVELLSKQSCPQPNFSHPLMTTPASGQHLTGHYHQPQVLHTRPALSYQYSPARQHLKVSESSFQQLLPLQAPSPYSRHSISVNGDSTSLSTLVHPTHPQITTPRHIAVPGSTYHFTPAACHMSQPIPSYHAVPSSKMNYNDFITGPSSHHRNQHLRTPTLAHTNSHSLPFPESGNNSYNINGQNTHNSNCFNSLNPNTNVNQFGNNSQFVATSVAKGGQKQSFKSGIVSPVTYTQAYSVNTHSDNLNLPTADASQHHHLSSIRDHQHHREALKTINEESLLSPFSSSQKLLQHQEPTNAAMVEVNDRLKDAEANGSSLRLPSINNSVRSSAEDSGLDCTPERLSMFIPQHGADSLLPADSYSAPAKSASCACASASCLQQNSVENIRWEQVPPEVITVLIHQSEQLRELQQQIQILTSKMALTNVVLPQNVGSDVTRSHNYTSVAVNTSFLNDQIVTPQGHTNYDSKSTQVTPVRNVSRQQELTSPATSSKQTDIPKTVSSRVEVNQKQLVSGVEPIPAGHNIAAMGQSVQQSQQGSPTCLQKDINQREFDKNISRIPSTEHTMNTYLSQPEFVSFNDRSQSDRSPSSTSDYNRQTQEDSYSTVGEDAADPNQFLSQVMKNIQMFLTNNESQEDSTSSLPLPAGTETTPQVSPTKLDNSRGSGVVPEVSSMSMLVGDGTDANQFMDINTLAMKYLSDQELTKVAKLHQTAPKKSHSSAAYSQQAMGRYTTSIVGSMSMPDVSQFGVSPCDMTIGTWMYLQKYGLVGNERSTLGMSILGNELKLRTDFSMMTNGSAVGDEAQFLQSYADPVMSSDSILSPVRFETDAQANNENWLPVQARTVGVYKDVGASPFLPASKNFARDGQQGYVDRDQYILYGNNRRRNVLQEVTPQAFANFQTGGHISPLVKPGPEEEDDENILDIEKLKQLPKLL